jgi:hypothetical protein
MDEKTLDDEVDELKETVEQLRFDIRQEREERKYETNEIRVDIGRVRLEKREADRMSSAKQELERIETELNHLIGVRWWKPYISSVWWSNLTTPLNIGMSITSLLAAGQASLNTFVSHSTTLSFSVFVLSLVNTFFTPHSRLVESAKQMEEWKKFGLRFERVYYSGKQTEEEISQRLTEYRELMMEIRERMVSDRSLFTDTLHSIVGCVKKVDKWV